MVLPLKSKTRKEEKEKKEQTQTIYKQLGGKKLEN